MHACIMYVYHYKSHGVWKELSGHCVGSRCEQSWTNTFNEPQNHAGSNEWPARWQVDWHSVHVWLIYIIMIDDAHCHTSIMILHACKLHTLNQCKLLRLKPIQQQLRNEFWLWEAAWERIESVTWSTIIGVWYTNSCMLSPLELVSSISVSYIYSPVVAQTMTSVFHQCLHHCHRGILWF